MSFWKKILLASSGFVCGVVTFPAIAATGILLGSASLYVTDIIHNKIKK